MAGATDKEDEPKFVKADFAEAAKQDADLYANPERFFTPGFGRKVSMEELVQGALAAPYNAPVWTVLEGQPEYLRAIGTIAVEIVNLEVTFAELLGALLAIPAEIADAIYFGPMATGPRLTIVKGVINVSLKNWPAYLRKAQRYVKSADDYACRRNNIIHESWGLSADGKKITRWSNPPKSEGPRLVPIKEIERLIYQTRVLAKNVMHLAARIRNDEQYISSLRKSTEQPS